MENLKNIKNKIKFHKLDILDYENLKNIVKNTGGVTSTRHPLAHGTAVLTLLLELIAVKHPLAYLGLPGLFLVVIGILFSVVVISLFNETRYFSVPNTLLSFGSLFLGILLILTAVILFAISRLLRR